MKEIETEELKLIQLEILEYLHQFCMENNIKYSLSSGTLIGAVRHKGFIPWDDDIDLYMLRPEYMRLIQEFNQKSHQRYRIIAPELDKKDIFPYAKVIDSHTRVEEYADHNYNGMGVWIDIFPVDSVPDDTKLRRKMFKQNERLDKMLILKNVRINKNRSALKNMILLLGKIALIFTPMATIVKKKLALVKAWNPSTKEICNVMAGGGIRCCIPRETMEHYIDIEFEGHTFQCMRDYDVYLRTCYGNYMQLPPKEKRITHHSFKAYWK